MKLRTFRWKRPLFIENYPPFTENFRPPPYRKLQPPISASIEMFHFPGKKRRLLDCKKMRQDAPEQQFKLVSTLLHYLPLWSFPQKTFGTLQQLILQSCTTLLLDRSDCTWPPNLASLLFSQVQSKILFLNDPYHSAPWPTCLPRLLPFVHSLELHSVKAQVSPFHTHVQTRPSHTTFRFYTAKTPHHQIGPRLSILR